MTSASLDPAAFQKLIERFAIELPELLSVHPSTAELSRGCEQLFSVFETPFTLAVIGQMRTGKSSLINTLVGADLAITGVNETTATVNWFRHGKQDRTGFFRVFWKDRPAEDFPLQEIQKWVGDSDRARATRCLEFYSESPFLRKANIVDTPGTRSVITDHTRATEEFLAVRQNRDSRASTEAADAVLYVLPPVARESDAELLREYGQSSRLIGSSPYNSLAVIHKWETLEVADPFSNALSKCEKVKNTLGDFFGMVFPVSAPLGRAAEIYPTTFWESMFELLTATPQGALVDLLLTESEFLSLEDSRCPLGTLARKELRSHYPIPWASFKAILKVGWIRKPNNHLSLKSLISQVSGIDTLRDALESRFFARARILKAFSIVNKGLEPSEVAITRLRNHKLKQVRLLEDADRLVGPSLARAVEKGAIELKPALLYVLETRHILEKDVLKADDVLYRLGDLIVSIKEAAGDLDADIRMLELLDNSDLGQDWQPILKTLFGAGGPSLVDRLSTVGCNLVSIDELLGKIQSELVRCSAVNRSLFEHSTPASRPGA